MVLRVSNRQASKPDPKDVQALLDIEDEAATYSEVSKSIKDMEGEKRELRDSLLDKAKRIGNTGPTGELVATTANHTVTIQKREKRTLDEAQARALLKKKRLLHLVERTEKFIDQAEIALLFEQGRISRTELESMLPITDTTEAVYVKKRYDES